MTYAEQWAPYPSRVIWAMHNPDAMDKDGIATILYPGQRKGRIRFGYATPASRRARRTRKNRTACDVVRAKRLRRDAAWTAYLLNRIDRESELREIEAILDDLAAKGEIIKHPDGTYQKKPTLADTIHARRKEARDA